MLLCTHFPRMVITLCYDAISRNVEGLGVSSFAMFTLSASAIFPACLVLLALQDRIGRKAMASSSLLLCGIFTATSAVILAYSKNVSSPELLVSLAMIGRFGVTVAYNSAAQYATELMPTCVRGQGIATVHVAGYAFTFFSSYILFLVRPETILTPTRINLSLLVEFLSRAAVSHPGNHVADGGAALSASARNAEPHTAYDARGRRAIRRRREILSFPLLQLQKECFRVN